MEQNTETNGQDKIFSILFDKDEITWQTIIYELINTGEIDPWDVNISVLTQKYIDIIKKLKELDMGMSGKVLLAAALLLKIKSNRLVGADLESLDKLFSQTEEQEDTGLFEEELLPKRDDEQYELVPRTPQPRKRKVSVYDLVGALEKALEVKRRRVMASIPPTDVAIPKKKIDINRKIKDIYERVKIWFSEGNKGRLTFSQLMPDDTKEGKVYTFIPLLHLTNQGKVDLNQYQHFGEIEVMLKKATEEVNKELGVDA